MMVRKERPDILITDIRMPGASGIDLMQAGAEHMSVHLHDYYQWICAF